MFDNSNRAFIAVNDKTEVCLIPKMANRHGLITGATGTGKTVTLQTLAETFSDMGVPVFAADMKGDLSVLPILVAIKKAYKNEWNNTNWVKKDFPTSLFRCTSGMCLVNKGTPFVPRLHPWDPSYWNDS